MSNGTEANEVVFDDNSVRVMPKFEVKIGAIAKRMLANKKLKLDIYAYVGKDNLTRENVRLTTQRLQAVFYILVNRYKIDQNRIKYDILQPEEGESYEFNKIEMVYR